MSLIMVERAYAHDDDEVVRVHECDGEKASVHRDDCRAARVHEYDCM